MSLLRYWLAVLLVLDPDLDLGRPSDIGSSGLIQSVSRRSGGMLGFATAESVSNPNSDCTEQSWCKTAPSTKRQEDGSENPGCKRWIEDCPCTCAEAVVQVEEENVKKEQEEKEIAAFEKTWTHLDGGGLKYV